MADDITTRIFDQIMQHQFIPVNHCSIGSEDHCGCGFRPQGWMVWSNHVAEQIVQQLGFEQVCEEYDEDGDRISPYVRWCTAWELVDKPVGKPTSGGPWHYLRTMMRRGGLD